MTGCRKLSIPGAALLILFSAAGRADAVPSIEEKLAGLEALEGFFDLYRDEAAGQLLLRVDRFDEPFLYQTSMPRGVGSNDLLLDRGQLGATQVARFYRSGPKVLLIADNLDYRADSENAAEREAVRQSFAESVLWGFNAVAATGSEVLVDATDFFLRDAQSLAARLQRAGQGSYTADATRSAIYMPRTRSFPDNTEVEALVTLTGQPNWDGPQPNFLAPVAPDPSAVSVHLHHSFIRLPDDGFEPLPFDPRSGYIATPEEGGYIDFSSPIGAPLRVQYAARHRLAKRDPSAAVSEPLEPIVYYLDPGVPEPVRGALLEGASWWNQAFAAAGYRDAFQVRLLPEGADPMDVRYNVIQWVHRSTRGWSYGSSVVDPRTGEIIKGHVTLGSLRVRQDYLIAEGLLSPYAEDARDERMLTMALARIRQLAAHEVGHTLGLEHNFAASVNDRASVMDYPFPRIELTADGELDLTSAYGAGIGAWDERAILWGYQDFAPGVDPDRERAAIVHATLASGLLFVGDEDARDPGTAHPFGNLWDNGADAIAELRHLERVRALALERFSWNNIRAGRPAATLEEALVPVYLLHRYQVEAVGKLLGGANFSYALRGDGQALPAPVAGDEQRAALRALLNTLDPGFLALPEGVAELIAPRPPGHPLGRETFARATLSLFDPLAPAAASVRITLDVLLNPARLERLARQHAADPALPGAAAVLEALVEAAWRGRRGADLRGAIQRATGRQALNRLAAIVAAAEAGDDVRAAALGALLGLDEWLAAQLRRHPDDAWRAHYELARFDIAALLADPLRFPVPAPASAPPGAPIGGH